MVVTRSASKAAGTAPPPVHGVKKQLESQVKPEHDKPHKTKANRKAPHQLILSPKFC